ncbi:site-specific integrase [Burkholderia cepacia]|uniref:hypothetical protein n=1 Tax=Burkholderia cepacia TaxID=292 RepID=UPI001CF3325A|nr:hypothetical protein [Burkholderia cepacia]
MTYGLEGVNTLCAAPYLARASGILKVSSHTLVTPGFLLEDRMATVRKRKNGRMCQVRKTGRPSKAKMFETKADALAWGRMIESEIDMSVCVNREEAECTRVADLLDRCLRDVSPTKLSGSADIGRAKALNKRVGAYKLSVLAPMHLAAYRDARLQTVSAQTYIHELNLLNRVLTRATREWGIVLPTGIPKIIKPRGLAPVSPDTRQNELINVTNQVFDRCP